jgi:DNA-directed RNA polymerase subunit E'/Rpb7
MAESMYHTMYLDERVSLSPSDLNEAVNIEDGITKLLESHLKKKYERRCNVNGYVRSGSVNILQRSMGLAENGRFTGNLVYDCKFKCQVLYPTAGTQIEAIVLKVNKMGVYAIFEDAEVRDEVMIRILLPRDIHLGNEEFDSIEEGDKLLVSLERSKFQTNDLFIVSVGRLIRKIPIS